MRYGSWIITVGVLSLAACGAPMGPYGSNTGGGGVSGGGGGSGGHTTTITVGNNFFSPTPDTILAGGVTFNWTMPSNGHTLKWDSGPGGDMPPDISVTMSGGSVFFAGMQPGTYQYHCTIHGGVGTGMHGTLVVQ
jgi:plastocyanin